MTTTIAPIVTTHAATRANAHANVHPVATAPTDAAASATTWVNVAEGLWVGSGAGEFRGTVEFVDGRFEASDERGTRLGHSHSLAGAKQLLDQPTPPQPTNALGWSDERTVLALGWLAFGASAIAAVSIATQLFV